MQQPMAMMMVWRESVSATPHRPLTTVKITMTTAPTMVPVFISQIPRVCAMVPKARKNDAQVEMALTSTNTELMVLVLPL